MVFIFDLYGTLVDIRTDENGERFWRAVEKYFRRINPQFGDFRAEYLRLCALAQREADAENYEINLLNVFKTLLNGADEDEVLRAAAFFRKKSRKKLKKYRGTDKLLQTLKGGGNKVYLLSNAQSCFTVAELEKLKLTKYFDGVLLSSDFGRKKPAKEFFEEILLRYGINRAEAVYAGNDFCADILGAKGAGLKTAYVKSNLSPASDSVVTAGDCADFATGKFCEFYDYLINESKK